VSFETNHLRIRSSWFRFFDGVQASGKGARYATDILPELSGSSNSDSLEITSAQQPRAKSVVDTAPVGRVRQRNLTTGDKLLKCLEKVTSDMSGSNESVAEVSVVRKAVMKLQAEYRHRPGWTTTALVMGYQLFENVAKADVFMGMDSGEDQDEWLRLSDISSGKSNTYV